MWYRKFPFVKLKTILPGLDFWALLFYAGVAKEEVGLVVHDQCLGEVCLGQEGQHVFVVGDVEADVGVAAQDDGHLVLLAEAQNLAVIGVRGRESTTGLEGSVVDLQQRLVLLGCLHDGFVDQLCLAVTGMADNLHVRVPDGLHHAVGVLLGRATLPAESVDAGDAQVQSLAVVPFIEVQRTVGVEDVQLGSHQQAHAIHLAGHAMEIAEVDGVAGAGDVGSVLGDAQYLQSFLGCGLGHLLHGAEGMAGDDGVGVDVKERTLPQPLP